MTLRRNTPFPAAVVAVIALVGAGSGPAWATEPVTPDQTMIDQLMGKADQTPPLAPAEGTSGAGPEPGAPPPAIPEPHPANALLPAAPTPPTVPPASALSQAISTPPEPPPPPPATTPARVGDTLWELVQGSEPLTLRVNQNQHRVGERLDLTLEIPKAGYLNILGVGPDDQPNVLYPNKYVPNNQVQPGPMKFPPANLPIALKAHEPVGVTRLFALLSEQPLNLYTAYQNGGAEALTQVFEPYTGDHEKAGRSLFHGARLEVYVCPAQGPCP